MFGSVKRIACLHAERDPLHQGLIVERAKLKPRGYQLDLASRLGKTQVVTNSTPLNQQVTNLVIVTCCLCHVLRYHAQAGRLLSMSQGSSTACYIETIVTSTTAVPNTAVKCRLDTTAMSVSAYCETPSRT